MERLVDALARCCRATLCLAAATLGGAAVAQDYVVLAAFGPDDPYDAAVQRLAEHREASVERFTTDDPRQVLPALRRAEPRYVAVVLRPEQLDFGFARRFLQLATELDDDPFVDFAFGYVTGRDAAAALALVERGIARTPQAGRPRIGSIVGDAERSLVAPAPHRLRGESLPGVRIVVAGEESHPEQGRDDAFLREHLDELSGCDVVTFIGHGWPHEVAGGPTHGHLAGLDLSGSVVLNVACYTGVTGVWYDLDYQRGVHRRHEVAPEESFCLALLDTGVVGYTAYVCPRPAGPELETDLARLIADGASLGDARRRDYDRTVLGFLGYGMERLELAAVADGATLERTGDVVRDLMLEGATGGLLFGDPAVVPFARREGRSPVAIDVEPIDSGLRLRATASRNDVYLHCADPTARFGESMAMRVHARVPIGDLAIADVVVDALQVGDVRLPTRVLWAVERDHGERFLQLKVNFPRRERMFGELEASVRIVAADDPARGLLRGGDLTPPPPAAPAVDVRAREPAPGLAERARERGVEPAALQAALDASAALVVEGDAEAALARLAEHGDAGFRATLALCEFGQVHYLTSKLFEATWRPGLERELIALAARDPLPNFGTWAVLESLGVADTLEVRTYLAERLATEQDAGLYMSTAAGLAHLGLRDSIGPIAERVLEQREGWQGVEPHLLVAIAELGGRTAVDALERIASAPDVRSSAAALEMLERIAPDAAARARSARDR